MKTKLAALLLAAMILSTMVGCRLSQPIQTPSPAPDESAAASPGATPTPQAAAQIPALPERFAGKGVGEIQLKVYDIKTKKVNEVKLDEYLYGVLAGEMRQDWPMEALKAQAIIARTFLMQFLTENKTSKVSEEADISTDPEESQAYDLEGINDNIRKAVDETSGMVITYNGQFIRAWFHSASGGKTADAVEGLGFEEGNPPYIQSVESDESQASAEFTAWEETFTADDISKALDKMGLNPGDEITEIAIGKTGSSGRATTIVIDGNDVPAPEFRIAMDALKFRSTFLTELKYDGKKLTVKGKGFGHGVGMPQWGAYQMANSGKKAEDIINYYFKGVSIVNLWNK